MTVDLAALAKLASEATPGPWEADMARNGHWDVVIPGDKDTDEMWMATLRGPQREADAAYIAAASPDVVLALVRVALAAKVHADATHAGAEVYRGLNDLRDALADLDR